MKTFFDCIPCFLRQSLDAVRMVTDDPIAQEKVLRGVLRLASELDLKESPPAVGQRIHRLLREISGNPDPYRDVKNRCNRFAEELLPWAEKAVAEADDPFDTAVRLAVAGNILDFAVHPDLCEETARTTIHETLNAEIDNQIIQQLKSEVMASETILYIGDNAGELVFDKILIEQIPPGKITFAVRGAPIINDATIEDADETGLTDFVKVIDNGSDAPGTILSDCSEAFRKLFDNADLIIAKGQGNYETLSDVKAPIWFLLKAKCPVISENIGCSLGAVQVIRQNGSGGRN